MADDEKQYVGGNNTADPAPMKIKFDANDTISKYLE